jgi:glycosyltransferase involved in cell wall biosynthesis
VKNAERIIFVPFIYGFGGVERLVLALSSFLHKHDIAHKVVCFNQTIDFSTYANWPMTVEELAPQRNPLSEIWALSFYMRAAHENGSPPPLFFDLKGAFYGGCLSGIDYYLHLTDPPSLLPSEISKFALSLRKIYPSLREKSNFSLNLMIRGELVQQINRRGASKALSVIAMSDVIADELHQIYEVKAKIIHPGVEKPTSSLTSSLRIVDKFRIISVCRLEANKRLDWILNALADLESSVVPLSNKIDWSLDVVGDGSMREELQELARQRGIAKRVVFHGKIPDLTVHNLIDDAHLFLMPAVQGYGLPALEALARGVPVILHRQSGVSEVLKGTPWVEIFDGDTVDLGSAINVMVERIGSNDLTKNTMPTFPSEADWAHEICMLCKWL